MKFYRDIRIQKFFLIVAATFCIFLFNPAFSETKIVNLSIGYKTVYFAGKNVQAIAVNNQIPAPTLHFKEGDHVVINVTNHLNEGTSVHWHGILIPWQMDGVEGVTQRAIQPGKTFHYHFTLRQSGTYWYHSHSGFQEQQGLYGAIIIDPKKPAHHYNKDFVVVLSDWSNTNPNQIFSNLKKEGDYYSPRFPLQPSLAKFIHDYRNAATSAQKKTILNNYKMMQQMRMSIYDISDVAYDAFLLNGKNNQHPWKKLVKIGDIVRLRFIGASASTNFNVKIPGHKMQIIQVDGNDIKPETVKHFFITPGETYDVLVKITNNKPEIIYAESADTLGHAIGALITALHQSVDYQDIKPFPEPKPVTEDMMKNMQNSMSSSDHLSSHKASMTHDMHMNNMSDMDHMREMTDMKSPDNHNPHSMQMMSMPTEATIHGDHIKKMTSDIALVKTTGTKYQTLESLKKTNDPHQPIAGVIRMELFGYMDRYIWMINGLPEYKAKPIIIQPGKRYRIIFTNNTMMHHPMHIHGHWFILRNGHGVYDPLLHTIDVPPGATVVADVDTDASGQWFFHCHHLYHMMAGMSRVFQYQTIIDIAHGTKKPKRYIGATGFYNRPIVRVDNDLPIIPTLIHHPMGHPSHFYTANFVDVGEDPWNNTQELTYKGMFGGDYNKLKLYTENALMEKGSVTDFNLDIFYWHLISQFWAIEAGANYFNQPAFHPYWQPGFGIVGLMPYFIDTELRTYIYAGSVKFDLELSRDTQITNNFFIRAEIEGIVATSAVNTAPIASGLNQMQYTIRPYYRVAPGWNVFLQYQYTKSYGLLASFDRTHNDSPNNNTVTCGVAVLF